MHNPEKTNLYLRAKQAYYFGTPIMSDAQFDALEDELRSEDPTNPALAIVGAPVPTNRQLQPATHSMPMGSQEKVNSFDEFARWHRLRGVSTEDFHASLKIDGSSLGLYYENGDLKQAITRGSGTEGEDVTASAVLFKNVPAKLSQPLSISVRCEAVLTVENWKKIDPEMKSNPRNIGSGILGRLDTKESHLITALAFDIQDPSNTASAYGLDLTTETGKSKAMESLGFTCAPWKGGLSIKEVQAFFEDIKAQRESLPFWIDGIVLKYDDLTIQAELGITSGKPKGQVAWKFPPEGATSTHIGTFWQVGHSGAITPVALITPTRIGGTTVTRASLANIENIKTLGIRQGSKVRVIRAGDVIPQITEVLNPEENLPEIEIPTTCPECASTLEKRKNVGGEESTVLFCVNPECPAQTLGKIKRFCTSRNILGIGDSIIESLLSSKTISSVPDLFTLAPEKMENLDMGKGVRLGKKRAETICKEIEDKATRMSLAEFLGAFGTRGLGVRRATLMIDAQPALENLEAWFDGSLIEEKFSQAAGVPKMGATILEGLKENEVTIRATLPFVTISATPPPAALPAGGKTFCITGSLPSGKKKKEYAPELAAIGCQLVDDLTKDVNFLVLSDPNGPESSKTKKANKLGIPLMSEDALVKFIEEAKATKSTAVSAPAPISLDFAEFAIEKLKGDLKLNTGNPKGNQGELF